MHHRDGRSVWVLDRGRVMTWTADGKPEWMFGNRIDVTQRKRQEEALRKSETFLARTGALAGVGGWEVDLVTNEVIWSDETCRIHAEEPGHRPSLEEALEYYPSEVRSDIQNAVGAAIAGGPAFDVELPLIRRDGQRIWVRFVGSAQFADNKPIRLVGAFQDVTDLVAKRIALKEANERVALATASTGLGIWDYDLVTGALVWDAQMYRLYGMEPRDELIGYDMWLRHIHPDDIVAAEQGLHDAIAGRKPFDIEFRIVWSDGTVRHLKATAKVTHDASGTALRIVGSNLDVSDPRRLAIELADQHELLRVTLQSIGDAVITTDRNGDIVWLNPVAERMTGWFNTEAKGRPSLQVFHIVNEETRLAAESPVSICLAQDAAAGLANDTVLISRNGEEFGIQDSASPIRNDRGELLGAVLVFHDVTEQRRLSSEMSYRATHDTLTGLVNRTEFEARLNRILQNAHENHTEHALLFIDLDQFKLVNDACGHSIGDQLLQQVGKLFGDAVRTRDTLARMGGDEFAVILENCPLPQGLSIATKICERMEDFRFVHEGRRFRMGASIGLVPIDQRWTNTAAILQAGDISCYAAKEAGRNRVHEWYDTDHAMRTRNGETQWATRIEHALDEDRFVLFAQRIDPIRGAARGLHAEALLRMVEPDGSLVLPGAFLPAAERFHLASRIDRWVLSAAIAWMKSVPSLDLMENLSINLSGQSIGDRAFHRWAHKMLNFAGPEVRARLCLEITETAAVTNLADAALFIEQVRAAGLRVALDDFGAGASSFGYLKSLTVDFIKIDGQFIRDLVDDPLDEAAVRCFVEVAKVVNLKTVAEFVDKPELLPRLREIGVDFAQGFLLHRPVPINELLTETCAEIY